MEDFKLLVSNSLEHYFENLEYTGYLSYDKVYNLIVLTAINFILEYCSSYITELDLKILLNALSCVEGDCNISFLGNNTKDSLYHALQLYTSLRATELTQLRVTNNNTILRLKI